MGNFEIKLSSVLMLSTMGVDPLTVLYSLCNDGRYFFFVPFDVGYKVYKCRILCVSQSVAFASFK